VGISTATVLLPVLVLQFFYLMWIVILLPRTQRLRKWAAGDDADKACPSYCCLVALKTVSELVFSVMYSMVVGACRCWWNHGLKTSCIGGALHYCIC
jgi:hypothetical protein